MELFKVAQNLYARTNTVCVNYKKSKDQNAARVAQESFKKIQTEKREFKGANLLEKVLKQIILAPLSLALRICLLAMNRKIAKLPVAEAPAPKAANELEALLMKATAVALPEEDAEEKTAQAEALLAKAKEVPLPEEDAEEKTAREESLLVEAAAVALPEEDAEEKTAQAEALLAEAKEVALPEDEDEAAPAVDPEEELLKKLAKDNAPARTPSPDDVKNAFAGFDPFAGN